MTAMKARIARNFTIYEKIRIAQTVLRAQTTSSSNSLRSAARQAAAELGVSSWTAIKYFYQLRDNEARGVTDPLAEASAFHHGSQHVNSVRRRRYHERIECDPEFLERTRRLRSESALRTYVPYAVRRAGDVEYLCRRLVTFARARKGAGGVSIHPHDLEAVFLQQGGKCPLTGLDMQLTAPPRHPLLPSLDRIDPSVGYHPTNVRFVCYFANLLKRDFTDEDVFTLLNSFRARTPEQGPLPSPPEIHAKLRGCYRNAMRRTRESKWTTDLTLADLYQLYQDQEGRCAVTGRILGTTPLTPFTMSIDRIDSSKHYTRDNVHLVCLSINIAKLDHPLPDFLDILTKATTTVTL